MMTLGADPDGVGATARRATLVYLRQHPSAWRHFDELLSDAGEGAAAAASRFDPARGADLGAYCYRRATGAILDAQRRRSPVARGAYAKGIRFDDLTAAERPAVALVRTSPDGTTYDRQVVDPAARAAFDRVDDTAALVSLLAALTERQRYVVTSTYLDGRPLSELADELGVSESAICQARRRALADARAAA